MYKFATLSGMKKINTSSNDNDSRSLGLLNAEAVVVSAIYNAIDNCGGLSGVLIVGLDDVSFQLDVLRKNGVNFTNTNILEISSQYLTEMKIAMFKRSRLNLDMLQSELALNLGVTTQQISNLERGIRPLQKTTCMAVEYLLIKAAANKIEK